MSDYQNGRASVKGLSDTNRQSRESFGGWCHEALVRIEQAQADYSSRLDKIEDKLETQLEIVATNTTSMSRSLELIQQTNSKLVDAISNKSSVPTVVVLMVIGLLAGVFLTRELAVSGGRAKFSLSGVDISSGAQPAEVDK
jgi:hypothetical protein